MISTVTTTTATAATNVALAGSLTLLVVVALLVFLMQKEILSVASSKRARTLSSLLNVAIIPLLLSFAFIVVVKVIQVLN